MCQAKGLFTQYLECAFGADSSVHTLMRIGVDAHFNSHRETTSGGGLDVRISKSSVNA